jgi:hypothetical protein
VECAEVLTRGRAYRSGRMYAALGHSNLTIRRRVPPPESRQPAANSRCCPATTLANNPQKVEGDASRLRDAGDFSLRDFSPLAGIARAVDVQRNGSLDDGDP